jgi:hypothetical protein
MDQPAHVLPPSSTSEQAAIRDSIAGALQRRVSRERMGESAVSPVPRAPLHSAEPHRNDDTVGFSPHGPASAPTRPSSSHMTLGELTQLQQASALQEGEDWSPGAFLKSKRCKVEKPVSGAALAARVLSIRRQHEGV